MLKRSAGDASTASAADLSWLDVQEARRQKGGEGEGKGSDQRRAQTQRTRRGRRGPRARRGGRGRGGAKSVRRGESDASARCSQLPRGLEIVHTAAYGRTGERARGWADRQAARQRQGQWAEGSRQTQSGDDKTTRTPRQQIQLINAGPQVATAGDWRRATGDETGPCVACPYGAHYHIFAERE